MRVVITGTSAGMGLAIAQKFLDEGHQVWGIDILPMPKDLANRDNYIHCVANVVADSYSLPLKYKKRMNILKFV